MTSLTLKIMAMTILPQKPVYKKQWFYLIIILFSSLQNVFWIYSIAKDIDTPKMLLPNVKITLLYFTYLLLVECLISDPCWAVVGTQKEMKHKTRRAQKPFYKSSLT